MATEKLLRKSVILAKAEATYGTENAPAVADGILCGLPEHDFSGDRKERNFIRDSISPTGFAVGVKRQTITFEVELKGANVSATPATPTKLEALLAACAMKPADVLVLPVVAATDFKGLIGATVTGETSNATGILARTETGKLHLKNVTGTFTAGEPIKSGTASTTAAAAGVDSDKRREYTPTSKGDEMGSVTIHYFMDGIKHTLVGCRGTAVLDFGIGGYPSIKFTFTGFYVPPVDADNPTGVTFEQHMPPDCLNVGLKIGNYPPVGIESLSLDLGITVSEKKDLQSQTGLSSLFIGSRAPKLTLDCDVDTLANFNPYSMFETGEKQAISWKVGSAAGNMVYVYVPEAQIEEPKKADKDGRAIYNLTFDATGIDNEFALQTA